MTANNNTRRSENAPKENKQAQPQKPAGIIYTCWRCNKNFELAEPAKPDTVRCPYCNMIHGLITTAK